jgi:hypothetical protein
MDAGVELTQFSRLAESLLAEVGKLDKKAQTEKKADSRHIKPANEAKLSAHNSLQHDVAVSAPLLTMLVDALKKDSIEETKEGLENIAEEATEKKDAKDAIVALAERIKHMYANELMQQAYLQANKSGYNPVAQYEKPAQLAPTQELTAGESYDEQKKKEAKAVHDENSLGYKLSKGDKYQAFIMTDPKGRLHSTWEIIRVINETADGMIERNDGYHSQMIL